MRMADQDPEQFFREAFPTEIPKAEEYIGRLEDLVRWLAIPFAGRTPIFAQVDVYSGRELPAGKRLAETWAAVMGDTGPAAPGVWKRCLACASWYVDSEAVPGDLAGPADRPWAAVIE